MEGNPYAGILALIRAQEADAAPSGESARAGLGAAPARMRLGTVVCAMPLTVKVAGITQPAGALRVNERLTKGAWWRLKLTSPDSRYNELTGPIQGPVTTPHGAGTGALEALTDGRVHSGDTTIDQARAEQLELDLEAGDEVLLLTEDDQVFYILMKVVKAV
ncbi:MAG: hypothetical protein HFF26_02435 [Oscillospiraceae bacterium]|nr:hypothetical protein [Oscillospiraceae bacterium]